LFTGLCASHLVITDPSGDSYWPRQCALWGLVREQALFCVPAPNPLGRTSTVFLTQLGPSNEGFLYMTALPTPWVDTEPAGEEDEEEEAPQKEENGPHLEPDVAPLSIVSSASSQHYVALVLANAPPTKLWTAFVHLARPGAVPTLVVPEGAAAAAFVFEEASVRIPIGVTLQRLVAEWKTPPEEKKKKEEEPLEPETHGVAFAVRAPAGHAVYAACLAQLAGEGATEGVLVAPLAIEHVEHVPTFAATYGVRVLTLEDPKE
jgi:hypothetical protein